MGALFLMDAAQKADRAFKVPPPTTSHTISDARKDVTKMAEHLLEKKTTVQVSTRSTPQFVDPTHQGWKKLTTTSWLKDTISRTIHDYTQVEDRDHTSVELSDIWDNI